jgi:tellurite resistance protein
MAINQNSPFTRIYADLPTQVALQLDAAAREAGKTKKQFIADAIIAACAPVSTSSKKKGK